MAKLLASRIIVILEMQRTPQKKFEDRAVFYACRCINEHAPNEKASDCDYKLKKVFMIRILDNFVLKYSGEAVYFTMHA